MAPARRPTPRVNRILRVSGMIVALLGVIFVIRAVAADWVQVRETLRTATPGWFALSIMWMVVSLGWIALVWGWLLQEQDRRISLKETLGWYFFGELGKYVPGGFWSVLGRSEFAARGGLSREAAYRGTLASLAATFGAALVVSLAMAAAFPELVVGLVLVPPAGLLWALTGLVTIGVVAGVRVLARPTASRAREGHRSGWPRAIGLVGASALVWLGMGSATWCVARSLGTTIGGSEAVFASATAWFAGFVVVPVPSGIGIREAVLTGLLRSPPESLAATIAITTRVVSLVADLIGATLMAAFVGSLSTLGGRANGTVGPSGHPLRHGRRQDVETED